MSRLLQDYSIEQKGADLLASQGFMERWEEDTTMFVPLHIKALSNANYSLALLIEHHREPENEKKKKKGTRGTQVITWVFFQDCFSS